MLEVGCSMFIKHIITRQLFLCPAWGDVFQGVYRFFVFIVVGGSFTAPPWSEEEIEAEFSSGPKINFSAGFAEEFCGKNVFYDITALVI